MLNAKAFDYSEIMDKTSPSGRYNFNNLVASVASKYFKKEGSEAGISGDSIGNHWFIRLKG